MSYFFNLCTCLILAGLCVTSALAENNFPATQYQGFENRESKPSCECSSNDNEWPTSPPVNPDPPSTQFQGCDNQACSPNRDCECGCPDNDWPTSPPVTPDPGPCVSDYRSMSPNSWSAPPTSVKSKNASDTPSVPDLDSASPFQPAGFARDKKSVLDQNSTKPDSGSLATPPSPAGDPFEDDFDVLNTDNSLEPNISSSVPEISSPFSSVDAWYDPVVAREKHLLADASTDSSLALPSSKYSTHSPKPIDSVLESDYRPDLGQRDAVPTIRNYGSYDQGQKFDFEDKKKQYPPMKEILATGRYFGSASALLLRPSFQGNTAITTISPGFTQGLPFDFDYEGAPQFEFGFESKYGPGIKLNYWQYDESSNPAIFTSNGVTIGETSTWIMGPGRWSSLVASNAGETIDARHSIDVESIGVSVFKEVKLPISRIVGIFGYRFVSVEQSLNATLSAGGSVIERLDSRFDINASGPEISLEYYRPIGHTKLEFVVTSGGSVLFGRRNQFVTNSATGDFSQIGADEFITTIDFMAGVQFKKMIAENRAWFARFGFQYENWLGGGTAVNAQDDFGLRGFLFTVGYNR